MAKEQGNSIRHSALFVDVVDVQCPEAVDVDIPREHGQLVVEFLFMLAPVVPVLPSFRESLDIGKWSAIFPVSVLELVRQGCEFEFSAENIKLTVRNGDGEWCFGHRGREVTSCVGRQ